MLRQVQSNHLGMILSGYQFTSASGVGTVEVGSNDSSGVASSATGKIAITQRETGLFKRGPIALVSNGANVADGGYGTFEAAPASGVIEGQTLNASGSGDDGSGHLIAAGFINDNTDLVDLQTVRATFPAPVLHGYYIDSDGTVLSGGNQATVVKNGTGDYTLSFTRNHQFARAVSAVGCVVNASAGAFRVASLSASSVNILTFNTSGTATDHAFMLFVMGSRNSFETGRSRAVLQSPQLKPRLVIGSTTGEGTPVAGIGGAAGGIDFTLSDEGTGDIDITFSKAFRRAPVVVVCAEDSNAQLQAAATTTGFTILGHNSSGGAQDDDFMFMALGYDHLMES